MNCCNENGNCTQGRDCPIRKQRAEETNKAYINSNNGLEPDLLDDVAQTFKALIVFIAVVGAMTLFTFWYWGK